MSTPTFTTIKTPEEYAEEKVETTRRELEKLHNALKDRVINSENKIWEEDFMEDSNDDEISVASSSTSSSTKEIISAISGIKNKSKKDKKSKKNKKQTENILVDQAVMVQKLKNEIDKLESRIRYKDLDMSNLNVEISRLHQFEEKFKLIENILNNIQQKELVLADINKNLDDILNSKQSLEYKKIKLNEMKNNKKSLTEMIDFKFDVPSSLKTLNQPVLTRLIMDKENRLINEFLTNENKIIAKLEEIKLSEEFFRTIFYFGGIAGAIGVLIVAYYLS
jgi:chromosome segregation ATPase